MDFGKRKNSVAAIHTKSDKISCDAGSGLKMIVSSYDVSEILCNSDATG